MDFTIFLSLALFALAISMSFGWLLTEPGLDYDVVVRRMVVGATWTLCAIGFTWSGHPSSNPSDALVAWIFMFVLVPRLVLHSAYPGRAF